MQTARRQTHRKTKMMDAQTFHGLPTDVFDSSELPKRKVDKYAAKRHGPAWAVARAFFARGSPAHPDLRPSPPKAQEGRAWSGLRPKKQTYFFEESSQIRKQAPKKMLWRGTFAPRRGSRLGLFAELWPSSVVFGAILLPAKARTSFFGPADLPAYLSFRATSRKVCKCMACAGGSKAMCIAFGVRIKKKKNFRSFLIFGPKGMHIPFGLRTTL